MIPGVFQAGGTAEDKALWQEMLSEFKEHWEVMRERGEAGGLGVRGQSL